MSALLGPRILIVAGRWTPNVSDEKIRELLEWSDQLVLAGTLGEAFYCLNSAARVFFGKRVPGVLYGDEGTRFEFVGDVCTDTENWLAKSLGAMVKGTVDKALSHPRCLVTFAHTSDPEPVFVHPPSEFYRLRLVRM